MFKLAFASCARIQDLPRQPAWDEIRAEQPDALLLLGDNVYLDEDRHGSAEALAAELRERYRQQRAEPGFAALLADLRRRGKAVMAIYDDHDFLGDGRCGADHDGALREAARAELRHAFDPVTTGADVYRRQCFGLVDVIVLDARFYRRRPLPVDADPDAVLGAAQWQWFERQLQACTAPYLAVASSITLHHFAGESWELYPGAFGRLRGLLQARRGALLLSGDVHRNAVYDDSGVIEIVSSAVARRGQVFGALRKNYGLLAFDARGVRVELRSLKVGSRFDFRIGLDDWRLP
ncbi:MAG: alkaline phosphatase D family protein [Rubrivivax sp.]